MKLSGELVTSIAEGNSRMHAYPEINRADINLSQLKRNVEQIRNLLKPDTKFMAIVKGDAYGHGLVPISKELERCGCDYLGVVRLTEALSLRESGIKVPIMILGAFMPNQSDWIVKSDITVMLDNEKIAAVLEKSAVEHGKIVNVHLKVNTGLNRYGVESGEVPDFIRSIKAKYPHIKVEGIYTHFRDAEFNNSFTRLQIERFKNVLVILEKEKLRPQIAHAAGSGGILLYPESHFDMVRCGIILYGLEHKEDKRMLPKEVEPLMTIKSYVLKIEEIKPGESGGYGDKFIARRDSKVAIIGIGYGDGISRGWKEILVGGQRVPVVNYFMDGIMVDITDVKNAVREQDEVVIVGRQGDESISWEEACNNINVQMDEQFQRITERVPKNYFYEDC